jgi:hypothetical protein
MWCKSPQSCASFWGARQETNRETQTLARQRSACPVDIRNATLRAGLAEIAELKHTPAASMYPKRDPMPGTALTNDYREAA